MPPNVRDALERAAAELFVGRERELAQLDAALEQAIGGRGRLILIAGEPGVGKTTLLESVEARARERGATVLWGRCWEGEGAPGFWPWVQVIRAYVRASDSPGLARRLGSGAPYVAQLVPDVRGLLPDVPAAPPLDSEQARFRLYDACSTFLKTAAADAPLVLILDDLHWADKSSLLLLQFFARELGDAPVLLVGTYRDVEITRGHPLTEALPRLRRERTVDRILLRGLLEEDVHAMLVALRGDEVPLPFARALTEETVGNPFFIKEILRHLRDEGIAYLEGDQWVTSLAADQIRLPESVREVIGRRLDRLGEPCTKLLTQASVVGREFGLDVMQRVSELTGERLLEVLEEAVAARIIEEVPQSIARYRFSHALIRETLYDELRTVERVRLHRRVAEVLEELSSGSIDRHVAELAHHFLEALPGGDVAKAVEFATRAGDRASDQLAYTEAAGLYERGLQALDLADVQDRRLRCELLLKLGEARWNAGGFESPIEVFQQAAELAESLEAPDLLARAALGLSGPGIGFALTSFAQIELQLFEKALAALDLADTPLRARVLGKMAAKQLFVRGDPRAGVLAHEAVEMARRIGDTATLAYVLNVTCWNAWGPDDLEVSLAVCEEIIRLAGELGDPRLAAEGHLQRASYYMEIGDPDAAQRDLAAQLHFAETSRQPLQRWLAALRRAAIACLEGRFQDSENAIREASDAEAEAGSGRLYGTGALANVVREHRRPPDDDDIAHLAQLEAVVAESQATWPRAGLARNYLRHGRVEEARQIFEQLAANDFADIPRDYMWLRAISKLSEVAFLLRDTRRAAILYDLLLPYAGRFALAGRTVSDGSVSRPLGLLATLLGRFEEAGRHFEAALEMNQRNRARIFVAYTQHDYARMLHLRGAPGDREKAADLIGRALTTAREIGMTVLEQAIVATLAEIGLAVRDETLRPPGLPATAECLFRKHGDIWTIAYEGTTLRLKDAKGLQYISHLLRSEGRDIHAAELAAGGDTAPGVTDLGDAGEVLDAQARADYRERLKDLEAELDEATRWGDVGRAARAREELEFLKDELSAAVGLGGRPRKAGNVGDRARKAVASRIQDAIAKIRKEHPVLALHLANALRTGTFCCYTPERPVRWTL